MFEAITYLDYYLAHTSVLQIGRCAGDLVAVGGGAASLAPALPHPQLTFHPRCWLHPAGFNS